MAQPIYEKKKGMATVNPLLQQNIYSSNGKFIGLTDGQNNKKITKATKEALRKQEYELTS